MFRSLVFVFFLLFATHSFAQLRANSSVQLKSKSNYAEAKHAVESDVIIITGGLPGTLGDLANDSLQTSNELAYAKSQLIRVLIRLSELTSDEQTYQLAIEEGTWQKIEKARLHWLNEIQRLTPHSTTEP